MRRPLILAALFFCLPAHAVTIDWVEVGAPGNAADPDPAYPLSAPDPDHPEYPPVPPGGCNFTWLELCGAVDYAYQIGKVEVTNAQYTEFLNAKAASDPLGLYDIHMDVDVWRGGITRSGNDGSYVYATKPGFESDPVVYVSFYNSIRFANWLNNGQGNADTETGAYTLYGGSAVPSNGLTVTRNVGATVFLPSENEWYKAAYYDPVGNGYFDYPAGADAPTQCSQPTTTPNRANCRNVRGFADALTEVGSYTGSASPNGTFDQGGNAEEWTEEIKPDGAGTTGSVPLGRNVRGGDYFSYELVFANYNQPSSVNPTNATQGLGFRVAAVPTGWNLEPAPNCEVSMSQPSYMDGEPVVITSLRFANQAPSLVTTRLRLQLKLPIGQGIVVDAIDLGADGLFAIPANFDNQLGPVTMFTLGPQIPIRGELEWRCALEDPATGDVISEDRAVFTLQ